MQTGSSHITYPANAQRFGAGEAVFWRSRVNKYRHGGQSAPIFLAYCLTSPPEKATKRRESAEDPSESMIVQKQNR
jgi:hypothetical protein